MFRATFYYGIMAEPHPGEVEDTGYGVDKEQWSVTYILSTDSEH
jgi:hypothetical protein